jgi:putative solute:sodium symporter small subunit
MSSKDLQVYWQKNLRILVILLVVWFVSSFLFGIVLVEPLNEIRIAGFKLGFFFAQQGSMYIFLLIIAIYVRQMQKLDREFDVHDD